MSFTNYLTFELGILGLLCWCVREQQAATQVGLEILPKLPGSCGYALVAEVGVKKTFTFSVNIRIGMLYRDVCKWKFIGENKNRIGYLFVNDFVVFESPGCKKDFVSIRDTDNEQSLIGKYCSPRQIPQTKRTTAGSTLIVNFQSITGFSSRFSIMYWAFEQSERCSATLYLGLRWPKAKAGETVSIRCHTAGDATWLCGQDGKYDPVGPTLDKDCIAQILEETVKGMSSSVKGGRSSMESLQDMMHIADRMLSADMYETWVNLPLEKKHQLLQSLANSIEESALTIALAEDKTLTITQGQIVVNVQTLAAHTHHNVTFCSDDTPDDGPIVHLHFDDRRDNRSEPITAVIVIYRNMSGMLRLNTSGGFHQDGANMTFERNFMTVSLYQNRSSSKLNATDNIVMSYTIPKTTPGDIGNRHCVFWDGALHGWSDVGCRLTQATHYKTACACDHLTFFAVLMDVSGSSFKKGDEDSGDMEKSLAILTYIGCGLSIVCLFISIICFFTLRSIWCQKITIHCNLCISLLLGQTLFIAAVDQTEEKTYCALVAGVLHFLFLSAFSWMCLEGVQLYLMLVKVLPLKYNRIAWFYLCGYGVPALIVGVSSAVYSEGYGTSTCCWLTHDHGFIWTFTGPVLLVMVINICFLIQTLRVIYKVGHGTMRSSHQDTHLQCFRRAARGAVLLQCILGTTWIIGYAYQGPSTLVFAYVFTTLNSTQGVFIFLFHVATNGKVLKAIKDKLEQLRKCRAGKGSAECTGCSNLGTAQNNRPVKQRRDTPAILSLPDLIKTARARKTSKIEPIAHPNSVNLSVANLLQDTPQQRATTRDRMLFPEHKVSLSRSLRDSFDQRDSEQMVLRGEEKTSRSSSGRFSSVSGESSNSNVTLVSVIKR